MDSAGWFGGFSGLVFGLILGSFIGMASWRWPRELSWLTPSTCPNCKKRLGVLQLIPLFSWLFQRKASRCCGQPISGRYAAIELTNGLLVGLAGWHFGLTPAFALLAILITALVLLSAIDFETMLVPDGASLTVAATGLGWQVLHLTSWSQTALDVGLSVLQGGGIGVLLAWGYSRLRHRDMLGWGDVKLMAASGFWLRPELVPAYVMIGAFVGILQGVIWQMLLKKDEFPFAPALALSLLLLIGWQTINY